MAKAATRAVPAAQFTDPTTVPAAPAPAAPAPVSAAPAAPAAPVDPFAGTTFYTADAWTPPKPPVSPTVVAFMQGLKANGSIVVVTDGWDQTKVNQFVKQVKDARHLVDNRRIGVKQGGTADGKSAIKVTLGKPATEATA